jgi:ABC-type transport system substrate-binding protein
MWKNLWPKMDVQVFKSAYSIIRPGLVGRTNTIPYAGDCDEGNTMIPFDWPKGLTETSQTRGGFGCGIEIPRIAETFAKVAKEVDINKRIQYNTELMDYLHDEAVIIGIVEMPNLLAYNPKAIKSWKGYPGVFGEWNYYVNLTPADR